MIMIRLFVLAGLMVLGFSDQPWAQTTIYHLHKEASSTAGLAQLKPSGPDATKTTNFTVSLKNKVAGEYLIRAFDTQAGVPGADGAISPSSTVTFALWMKNTASVGTMYPRAKLTLNNTDGASICTVTGTSALTSTLTKQTFSCITNATVTLTPSDRFYLWVGVVLADGPWNINISGQVSVEGALNGNYDSQVAIPTPPTECSDGIDNDADGLTDYNATAGAGDPDCASPSDNLEPFLRQPLCASDGEYRIVPVYVYTDGNSDRSGNPATVQRIRDYVAMVNGILWRDGQELGASREFKVKCSGGVTDVLLHVKSNQFGEEDVVGDEAAARAGANSLLEQYWIFLDNCHDTNPDDCSGWKWGFGSGCTAEAGNVDNCGNQGPRYGSVAGNMVPTLSFKKWGPANVMSQEGLHAMGIMNRCAPHNDGLLQTSYFCASTGQYARNGAHGNDGRDPMSAGPLCQTGLIPFDCNNDDFFHPNPPVGNYLHENFNLGADYMNWIDGDGIYAWTGYTFNAEQASSADWFVPREMTKSTTAGVGWTVVDAEGTQCGIPSPASVATSGPGVYALSSDYGICGYATGTRMVADMTVTVNLSRTYAPTLDWSHMYDLREGTQNCPSGPGTCDSLTVHYSTNGGGTWIPVWNAIGSNGDQSSWIQSATYNLAAGCTTNVKVRFRFDSLNAVPTTDTSRGWFIDAIKVSGVEGGCSGQPTAPASLVASHDGGLDSGQIRVDWAAPVYDGGNPITYRIYRGTLDGGPKALVASVPGNTLTYLDTGLTIGTIYYYQVTALSSGGIESPRSPEDDTIPMGRRGGGPR